MAPSAAHEESVDTTGTVVVVGAGPSGLMIACNLVRFGINIVLLDDRPDKTTTGKADGIQPKTIETLRQLRLAESLLANGARVYDIAFWQSTAKTPLHRTGRQKHYPDHLVGASDPYILLAHQGMLEGELIQDLESREVLVTRNSSFVSCSRVAGTGQLDIAYEDLRVGIVKSIRADYLIGCDGARSKVRSFIPDAELDGDMTNALWGVLDGVVETDFPDLWSKVIVQSHAVGSILWIPRERNMTRLYVELSATDSERVERSKASLEYVMQRAREAMHPFHIEWKTVEWFGNYVVRQRVSTRFMDPNARIFIAGDAGHCHSALAAQGANTSMHDAFNLAWKLNLVIRGLAQTSLLLTYEEERRKIAKDLIQFDIEHSRAFAKGEPALSKNFSDNIRFISGVGAEYNSSILTRDAGNSSTSLQPGKLQIPAKVTRMIDANPIDIQLDIPILGQFRIYFFVPSIPTALGFLMTICDKRLTSNSLLSRISSQARHSYTKLPRKRAPSDEFTQPQRYTAASDMFTYAIVTQSGRSEFEVADLPQILRESRWTLYLDDVNTPSCTEKWCGNLDRKQVGIVIIRPDGYIGATSKWDLTATARAGEWLDDYFGFIG